MRGDPASQPDSTFTLPRWCALPVVLAVFLVLGLLIQSHAPRGVRKTDAMDLVVFLATVAAYWLLPVWLARRFGARPRVEARVHGLIRGPVIVWDDLLARDRHLAATLAPLVTIPVAAALLLVWPSAALGGLLMSGTLAVGPLWVAAALLLRAPRDALVRNTGDGFEVY